MSAVLLACAASTLFMVGVAWFVQVVHYPLFEMVGEEGFAVFHDAHSRRTGYVVALPMILELLTSLVLVAEPPGGSTWLAVAGALLAVSIWASTLTLLAPHHGRIGREGLSVGNLARLVRLSWPRTLLWSAHGVVVVAMLALAIANQ